MARTSPSCRSCCAVLDLRRGHRPAPVISAASIIAFSPRLSEARNPIYGCLFLDADGELGRILPHGSTDDFLSGIFWMAVL